MNYRGRIDAARPGNRIKPSGESVREAARALLNGETIPEESMKPSMGCNIKWAHGNEPDYY